MQKTLSIQCPGYEIVADWYQGSTDEVLLILMGFTSSRGRQAVFTEHMVHKTGASALVIDYSGHGDSPFDLKDTSPAQHVLEVVAAYDWIITNQPSATVSVVGNSYGSFLASNLLQYRPLRKLVLRAPAIYRPEKLHDKWAVRFADNEAYDASIAIYRNSFEEMSRSPLFRARELNRETPVLVVAHEHDEIVPRETAKTYATHFNAELYIAEGFKHAVSQSDVTEEQLHVYHEYIADWLA